MKCKTFNNSSNNLRATGYYTKYDCSGGDISLLGGIDKIDIRRLMHLLIKKNQNDAVLVAVLNEY